MKKLKIILCVFIFGNSLLQAQDFYIDPDVSIALFSGEAALRKAQNATMFQQILLTGFQEFTTEQVEQINETQDKLYKGLKDVPNLVKDLNIVNQIRKDVEDCILYKNNINKLVKKHPDYKVYSKYVNENILQQAIDISVDLKNVLASGDNNLATSGDRYKLIFRISEKVTSIKEMLYRINTIIKLGGQFDDAHRRRNENLLTNYINNDRKIIETVMNEYKDKF